MEKIVRPAFKEMKNRNEETPYVVFARTHEELRTKGEKWMIDTANYSMVVDGPNQTTYIVHNHDQG